MQENIISSNSVSFSPREESRAFAEGQTTKDQIFEYISTHPGSHLRQIKRDLDAAMGVIQYHLYSLESESKILSRRRGLYKRFYPNLVFGEHQQDILDVLSLETERDLVLFLIKNPNSTQKQLAEYAKISPGNINWHMKRLLQSGLVSSVRDGHFVKYKVEANPNEVLKLIRSYHPSVWDLWSDRFANLVEELSESEDRDN